MIPTDHELGSTLRVKIGIVVILDLSDSCGGSVSDEGIAICVRVPFGPIDGIFRALFSVQRLPTIGTHSCRTVV